MPDKAIRSTDDPLHGGTWPQRQRSDAQQQAVEQRRPADGAVEQDQSGQPRHHDVDPRLLEPDRRHHPSEQGTADSGRSPPDMEYHPETQRGPAPRR